MKQEKDSSGAIIFTKDDTELTLEELRVLLEENNTLLKRSLGETKERPKTPVIGGIYRHFKGNLYRVIAIALHHETGKKSVIYEGLYGNFDIYHRELEDFMSEVNNPTQKYRFELNKEVY